MVTLPTNSYIYLFTLLMHTSSKKELCNMCYNEEYINITIGTLSLSCFQLLIKILISSCYDTFAYSILV